MFYDWHIILGAGSSLLLLALIIPYLRSIFSGTTRPSAVSWFGWAFLFAIAAGAQASKGIDWSLAVPVISTMSTLIIAVVALIARKLTWTRADWLSIGLGLLALALWAITREPLSAIILSIIADAALTVPTMVKTYEDPKSEPAILWSLYVIGALGELAATKSFTIYNLLYPAYAVLGSVVIAALAFRRNKI